MNKTELVEYISKNAGLTKEASAKAIGAFTDAISTALKKGEQVSLVGFGSFSVRNRAARTGRNPQTGEPIQIKATKTPVFKAGKALKDAVH